LDRLFFDSVKSFAWRRPC